MALGRPRIRHLHNMSLAVHLKAVLTLLGVGMLVEAAEVAALPPSAPPAYSAADLEKLVAPIALHPDPLIAIILPASVYPLEIVQAARFIQATNNLPKVPEQPWDENVKALTKFPGVIEKMNDDLTWTMDLGRAFLDQQKEVMDTIQTLRAKAESAGVLKTSPQQVIVVTNTVIQTTVEQQIVFVTNTVVQIQPSNPEVVYVPTYPPTIYYPPPVYVGPPPVITFAAGIAVGAIIANNCDWNGGGIYVGHHGAVIWGGGSYHGHGDVGINIDRDINIGGDVNIGSGNINTGARPTTSSVQKWQPDQTRMSSSGASGSRPSTQTAQARGWSSGTAQASSVSRGTTAAARPSAGVVATPRPSAGAGTARTTPSAIQSYNRPAPSTSPVPATPSTSRPSAFSGVSSGASTRQSSTRGSFSRSGGGARRR